MKKTKDYLPLIMHYLVAFSTQLKGAAYYGDNVLLYGERDLGDKIYSFFIRGSLSGILVWLIDSSLFWNANVKDKSLKSISKENCISLTFPDNGFKTNTNVRFIRKDGKFLLEADEESVSSTELSFDSIKTCEGFMEVADLLDIDRVESEKAANNLFRMSL